MRERSAAIDVDPKIADTSIFIFIVPHFDPASLL
jgi:hypothetical protein